MHKVERNEAPDGLLKKHLEFQNKYKNVNSGDEWKKFSGTKLKKETVEKLQEMYKGCCAYCEGEYVGTSYPQIDHFKPKHLYPKLTFDYNNMNLSCEECNKRKSDNFNDNLIDPSKDNPDEHIKFVFGKAVDLDERGKTSIIVYNLNDPERVKRKEDNCATINDRLDMLYNKFIEAKSKNEMNESLKSVLLYIISEVEESFKPGLEYCTTYRHNFEEKVSYLKKYIKEN